MTRQNTEIGTVEARVGLRLVLAVLALFARTARAVEPTGALPAGTVIYLCLSTPVSSKSSKNHDAVKATVARDVTAQSGVVIPVGAVLTGRIEKLVKSSRPDERDQLQLSFTSLELPGNASLKLEGHLSEVDNARETLQDGTIQGVLESEVPLSQINRGLGKLSESDPQLGGELAKIAEKNLGKVDTSIILLAGTDLRFALDKPLTVSRVFPPAVPDQLSADLATTVETLLSSAPQRASSKEGKPGDPLNLVVIGTVDQIRQAFQRVGWNEAEQKTNKSIFDTVRAVIGSQGYDKAPVSQLYVFGRQEDLAFEKMFNTFNKRHHLRLWRTELKAPGGRDLWLGAATHDIGIEASGGTISHAIDPNLDDEREKVGADLALSSSVAAEKLVTRPNPLSEGLTATGGRWHTDGALLAIVIK